MDTSWPHLPIRRKPTLQLDADDTPMGMNMNVVLTGKETVVLEDRPIPEIGPNDVLVKVMSTGICGTDLTYYLKGGVGSRVIHKPLVLGHESSGIVYKCGKNVTDVLPGDRVAMEPALPCRTCRFCRAGQFNYCARDKYFATPPTDGSLCQWYALPSVNAVKIPNNLSWEEAGCIQPLAIAVQIARRAGSLTHKSVAVFGCGPLGLLCMAVAKACGASKVIAFDIDQGRIDFAKKYAATDGFVSPRRPQNLETTIMEWNDKVSRDMLVELGVDGGLDVVLECSGAEPALQLGISLLRPGGTFVAAGMGAPMTSFPTLEMAAKELDIRGSLRYTTGCFEDGIDLLERGLVNLKPLISKTYPLSKTEDAFKARKVAQGTSEIKIVIMNQE